MEIPYGGGQVMEEGCGGEMRVLGVGEVVAMELEVLTA